MSKRKKAAAEDAAPVKARVSKEAEVVPTAAAWRLTEATTGYVLFTGETREANFTRNRWGDIHGVQAVGTGLSAVLQLVCESEQEAKVISLRPGDLDTAAMDSKILTVLDSNHGITQAMIKKCLQSKKCVCCCVSVCVCVNPHVCPSCAHACHVCLDLVG